MDVLEGFHSVVFFAYTPPLLGACLGLLHREQKDSKWGKDDAHIFCDG